MLHDYHPTEDTAHGRVERRQYWTIADPEVIAYLTAQEAWPGLRSVGMGDRGAADGRAGDPRTSLLRHELGGQRPSLWVLDLAFAEDRSRMRKDHSQQNFVVLRHRALNLLKQERTAKCGIKARRLKAGWSEEYLRKVLTA